MMLFSTQLLDSVAYILVAGVILLAPKINKWGTERYRKMIHQLQKNRKYETEVKKIINTLQIRYGAMRVIIWSYFNGIKNVVGQPAEFLSITYEKTSENTQSISDNFQMIPTTLWKDAIADAERHRGVLQIDIDTAGDDMRFYMHKYGIERTYQIKINPANIGQGLITIDFPSMNHSLDLKDVEFLEECCRSINMLMKKIK